jgi:hypothetical protein
VQEAGSLRAFRLMQPPAVWQSSVGVGYPDTQLILPWFLNDIINFINYR